MVSDERYDNDDGRAWESHEHTEAWPSLNWGSLPRASSSDAHTHARVAGTDLRARRMTHERPEEPSTVLLAMEDLALRRVVAAGLRRFGCRVIEAADGAEMLAYLDLVRCVSIGLREPDLIVAAASMEGSDALAAYERARIRSERVPVIFVTPPRESAVDEPGAADAVVVRAPGDASELLPSILAAARRR
jgi:CheY-like chemotaxis protein